jgi:hypothetical protein
MATTTVSGPATVTAAVCCAPLGAASLSDAEAEATARVFKALADPHRLRIVNLLATSPEPVCVCEFTKSAVFAETYRVLRPGGRIGITDVVAEDQLTPEARAERGAWVGCIAGALSKAEYEAELAAAGFAEVSVTFPHVDGGLHSAIIRATRPADATAVPTAAARVPLPMVEQSGCC